MNRKVKIFTFILLLMATLVAMIGCTPVQEKWIAILFGVMLLIGVILLILGEINDNSVMYVLGGILDVIGLLGLFIIALVTA